MSPNVSTCAKGAEHPPQGSWCLYPHTTQSARGGSVLLASCLHVVNTRCVGCRMWLPDRLWRGSGAPHTAPHAAVLCFFTVWQPQWPIRAEQAGQGQTTWSSHTGWQDSLPKATTCARLDVSISPCFLSWCLERAVGGWAEAGVVQEAAVHLRLRAEHCFSTTDSAQAYSGTCHLPVALSLVWPLSLVYSVPQL